MSDNLLLVESLEQRRQLAAATPAHTAMHLGQIQVIRRKLGKPVLF